MHSLYMAWRYLVFHKVRTVVLIAAITLITYLPFAVHILVRSSEAQMLARSQLTPLIIGQKGSALDLVLNTLYFTSKPPERIAMGEADRVDASGLAYAIPVYNRFVARGFPIVGTTLDYFSFRQLDVAAGRMLAVLGECVLGATVAATLGLEPGDTLMSAPENPFDLAGVYPLKMHVVGVLNSSHTPDDRAVFVDIKTAWVIEGLGHGHTDLATTTDQQNILEQRGGTIVASAKVVQYTEITPDNIDSFHFHGDTSTFPLTAILAVPHDDKSATLLRGRYLAETIPSQIVRPTEVIAALLQNIFKFKQVLDIIFTVVSVAMILAIVLIMTLSLRLRQPEIETMYKLGCSRLKMVELVAAELGAIVLLSLMLTAGLTAATLHWQLTIMHRFLA
jgi:putative ABC transport system permease protein